MKYEEIILNAYAPIDNVIKEIDELVLEKCLHSYSLNKTGLGHANDVIELMSEKEKLLQLKQTVATVLKRFSQEEIQLLSYKYFNNKQAELDHSSRTYFRKQQRLLAKFKEFLSYINLTEEVFEKDYSRLSFIKKVIKCAKNKKKAIIENRRLAS